MGRSTLVEKLIDKGYDGADIHYFMVKHDLAEPFMLTGFPKIDADYIDRKMENLANAHAEIDHTKHK